MKKFAEWLEIQENNSALGYNFNNPPIASDKIGNTTVSLVPIDYNQPGHGERTSDFGLLVKNQHGEAKAYLSPNKSMAMEHYEDFLHVLHQLVSTNPENEAVLMRPDTLDKLLYRLGVK